MLSEDHLNLVMHVKRLTTFWKVVGLNPAWSQVLFFLFLLLMLIGKLDTFLTSQPGQTCFLVISLFLTNSESFFFLQLLIRKKSWSSSIIFCQNLNDSTFNGSKKISIRTLDHFWMARCNVERRYVEERRIYPKLNGAERRRGPT